jgi:hypothetical protein
MIYAFFGVLDDDVSVPPGDGAGGWGCREGGIAECSLRFQIAITIRQVFEFGTDPLEDRLFLHSPPSAGLTSKQTIGSNKY